MLEEQEKMEQHRAQVLFQLEKQRRDGLDRLKRRDQRSRRRF